MQEEKNNHHQPPSDEATRKKIDKHLSDESDTISEEDIKNINTNPSPENPVIVSDVSNNNSETNDSGDDNKIDKEVPSSWEIKE